MSRRYLSHGAALSAGQDHLTDIAAQIERLQQSLHPSPNGHVASVRAARWLNYAAGTLALSVLLDSGIGHYRGGFRNRAMLTPLLVSALSLIVSVHGTADSRHVTHRVRQATYAGAAATALVGTGFHFYNVLKRPGHMAWQNLFYGAPLGAPMALLLSGLLGSASEHVRGCPPARARLFGRSAGRVIAALTGAGLFGTTAEAALLHFRGAFHNKAMFAPVTIPPAAGLMMLETALGRRGRDRWFTRLWMRATALMGVVGCGFHAWGIQRNMGGWRNWRQTLLNGPPLPAPPSFSGLALAGLAALGLLEDHPDG